MSDKVYSVITDQIIKMLEQGNVPWRQTWTNSAALGQHKNLISQNSYRGINAFVTAMTAISKGYKSPYWLTYKQALELGGHVKQGEKSIAIVYYSVNKKETEDGTEKSFGFARYSRIFNSEQIECPKLAELVARNTPMKNEFNAITECESIVASYKNKPEILHEQQAGYYMPRRDIVNMPKPETFESAENYYSVLFHELTHSTGHANRLARPGVIDINKFGSHEYSKEELIAEMGAAFLCAHAGIATATIQNSAAYIQSWLKVLKGEPKLVLQSASQAQKSTEYIIGVN